MSADLDIAAGLRRMHDEVVDAQPQHDVTRVVDEIAGLGTLARAGGGIAQLGAAVAGQLDAALAPRKRGEPGTVEGDAGLAGIAVIRHADLGQRREERDLMRLIGCQPRLVQHTGVGFQAGGDRRCGVLETNAEGAGSHRCQRCSGTRGHRVDGRGDRYGGQLCCAGRTGTECHEPAAEHRGSEHECCKSLTDRHVRVPSLMVVHTARLGQMLES